MYSTDGTRFLPIIYGQSLSFTKTVIDSTDSSEVLRVGGVNGAIEIVVRTKKV